MERLQGPLNSCFFGEHLEVNCLEQGFVDYAAETLRFDEEEQFLLSSLEDNMPFLQMLQSVEYSSPQQCFFPLKEPTFQTLLRLQHMKNHHHHHNHNSNNNVHAAAMEVLERCVTHDMVEMHSHYSHSPVKSESYELQQQQQNSIFPSCVENKVMMSYECNQEQTTTTEQAENNNNKTEQGCSKSQISSATKGERRKRKRTRPAKNKEDVENQRMTHIAVERNRRRQMNDHLSVLRSLMPPSYIQRGDQASIIGGAIDFVKELEQLLQSLEAQKGMRKNNNNSNNNEEDGFCSNFSNKPSSTTTTTTTQSYGVRSSSSSTEVEKCGNGDEIKAENKSGSAEIEVTLIQTHVNLKIQCQKKPGQLVKAIVALEDLRLSILHLNITSSVDSVLYSLNLKIEEGCKLSTANEIAEAVHHIFDFING